MAWRLNCSCHRYRGGCIGCLSALIRCGVSCSAVAAARTGITAKEIGFGIALNASTNILIKELAASANTRGDFNAVLAIQITGTIGGRVFVYEALGSTDTTIAGIACLHAINAFHLNGIVVFTNGTLHKLIAGAIAIVIGVTAVRNVLGLSLRGAANNDGGFRSTQLGIVANLIFEFLMNTPH